MTTLAEHMRSEYADVLHALRTCGVKAAVECMGGNIYSILIQHHGWDIIVSSRGFDGLAHNRSEHDVFEIGRYETEDYDNWVSYHPTPNVPDLTEMVLGEIQRSTDIRNSRV